MIEFVLSSISPEGLLCGANQGRDIPIGTTFTSVTRYRVRREGKDIHINELGEVGQISLTLLNVHMYGHIVDHVPHGCTAGLAVTGDGLKSLAGWLSDLPPFEHLRLVAIEG